MWDLWYVWLAAELAGLFILIKLVDWRAKERERRLAAYAERVREALKWSERDYE